MYEAWRYKAKDIIKKHGNELKNHSEFRLGQGLPYGKKLESNALGFRMNVHLFYDAEKALKETNALYAYIDSQENDLNNMTEPPERRLGYDKYFFINRTKDGRIAFRKNNKAIDEQLEMCGFFLIAETDFKKTTLISTAEEMLWKKALTGLKTKRI